MDPQTGSPKDAWLSEETRQALVKLSGLSETELTLPEPSQPLQSPVSDGSSQGAEGDQTASASGAPSARRPSTLEQVEMPLITNSSFFRVLRQELSRLDDLQQTQQRNVEEEILKLGHELTSMLEAGSKKSKHDMLAWREIFRIYVESEIFFSSREKEGGASSSEKAGRQLELFRTTISSEGLTDKLTKDGRGAFDRFLQINSRLLQYLQFQELNQKALAKILKKFDKRTALHAGAILPPRLAEAPFIAQSLARSACFKISKELLAIIPQLNDYLCPICFNVSFKPVRLKCDHVFCIRCLVVMQREHQDRCPLCRGASVMEASSGEFNYLSGSTNLQLTVADNLDLELMEFLKTNFPREVKIKQKENERAAGVDRYGEDFDKAKCAVM